MIAVTDFMQFSVHINVSYVTGRELFDLLFLLDVKVRCRSRGAGMENDPITETQSMSAVRFSRLHCVVSYSAHAISSQCESLKSVCRKARRGGVMGRSSVR